MKISGPGFVGALMAARYRGMEQSLPRRWPFALTPIPLGFCFDVLATFEGQKHTTLDDGWIPPQYLSIVF